jgi:hypothetical protein
MVLNLPLMSALTTPTYSNKREKKKKRNEQKETSTSDRKPKKGEEQDHLKKTCLGPFRQGNGSTHPRQNKAQAKSANHQTKARKTTNSSPCTHASSPRTNATPSGRMHAKHHLKHGSCNNSALTSQTGHHHRSDWCPTYEQGQTGQTGAHQSPEMARNHLKTF